MIRRLFYYHVHFNQSAYLFFIYEKLYAPVFVICVFHVRMGIWKRRISKVINLNYNVDLYIYI